MLLSALLSSLDVKFNLPNADKRISMEKLAQAAELT